MLFYRKVSLAVTQILLHAKKQYAQEQCVGQGLKLRLILQLSL